LSIFGILNITSIPVISINSWFAITSDHLIVNLVSTELDQLNQQLLSPSVIPLIEFIIRGLRLFGFYKSNIVLEFSAALLASAQQSS